MRSRGKRKGTLDTKYAKADIDGVIAQYNHLSVEQKQIIFVI